MHNKLDLSAGAYMAQLTQNKTAATPAWGRPVAKRNHTMQRARQWLPRIGRLPMLLLHAFVIKSVALTILGQTAYDQNINMLRHYPVLGPASAQVLSSDPMTLWVSQRLRSAT